MPGESISKYQRHGAEQTRVLRFRRFEFGAGKGRGCLKRSLQPAQPAPPISEIFASDEPLFAELGSGAAKVHEEPAAALAAKPWSKPSHPRWDREQKRLHEMNVAAVFGREETVAEERAEERDDDVDSKHDRCNRGAMTWTETARILPRRALRAAVPGARGGAGTLEEEEIEEEEADLAHYVEDLEEDAAFEELEEETHAAGGARASGTGNCRFGGITGVDHGAVFRGRDFFGRS